MDNISPGPLRRFWDFISSPNYRRTLSVLGILVLVAAIPLTVFIAQKQQEIRQRASGNGSIEFVDNSGNPLPSTISDPNVYLKVTLPDSMSYLQNAPIENKSIVPKAYADSCSGVCKCISESKPFGYTLSSSGSCDQTCSPPTVRHCDSDGNCSDDPNERLCYVPSSSGPVGTPTPTPSPTGAPPGAPFTGPPNIDATNCDIVPRNFDPSNPQTQQMSIGFTSALGPDYHIFIAATSNDFIGRTDFNNITHWTTVYDSPLPTTTSFYTLPFSLAGKGFDPGDHLTRVQVVDRTGRTVVDGPCGSINVAGQGAPPPTIQPPGSCTDAKWDAQNCSSAASPGRCSDYGSPGYCGWNEDLRIACRERCEPGRGGRQPLKQFVIENVDDNGSGSPKFTADNSNPNFQSEKDRLLKFYWKLTTNPGEKRVRITFTDINNNPKIVTSDPITLSVGATGTCGDRKPNETKPDSSSNLDPSKYIWKNHCDVQTSCYKSNDPATAHDNCKQFATKNDPFVDENTSYWCYGFQGPNGETDNPANFRCLSLQYTGARGKPPASAPPATRQPEPITPITPQAPPLSPSQQPSVSPAQPPPAATATPNPALIAACSQLTTCRNCVSGPGRDLDCGWNVDAGRCVATNPSLSCPVGVNRWANNLDSCDNPIQCNATPGAPSPTATPIPPTATPVPGGVQIALTLKLDGIGGRGENPSPQRATRDVTVQLFDQNNNKVVEKSATLVYNQQAGIFAATVDMGIVNNGSYLVKAKVAGRLTKLIQSILQITGGGRYSHTGTPELAGGDITNDNVLDALDYNQFVACFGAKANSPSCTNKAGADINDDGAVDGVDYNLFIRALSVRQGD